MAYRLKNILNGIAKKNRVPVCNQMAQAEGIRDNEMHYMSRFRMPQVEGTLQDEHIHFLKADLHGTIFAYDCRMRFL